MPFSEDVFLKYLQKKQYLASIVMTSGLTYTGNILTIDKNAIEIEEWVNRTDRKAVLIYRQYIAVIICDETYSWESPETNREPERRF